MKFVRAGKPVPQELSDETLQLGDAMELVHFSQYDKNVDDGTRGCWAQQLDPVELLKLIDDGSNASVLQSTPEDFESDVRAWVQMRQNPAEYFVNPLQCLLPGGS